MSELALTLDHFENEIQEAIDAAAEHFDVIGRNLKSIREAKLYRPKFESFDEYVSERWGFTANYARRLVSAATVVANLESVPAGTPEIDQPTTERQCRELSKSSSDPKTQSAVWETAVAISTDGNPTAPVIQRAAEIVTAGTPINHESLEIDEAVGLFVKSVGKLIKIGQRIQVGFAAKAAVCKAMQSRAVKFQKLIDNMASRADLLREDIEDLAAKWGSTKKQVDDE